MFIDNTKKLLKCCPRMIDDIHFRKHEICFIVFGLRKRVTVPGLIRMTLVYTCCLRMIVTSTSFYFQFYMTIK